MSLIRKLKRFPTKFSELIRIPSQIRDLKDLLLYSQTRQLQVDHPNPLNRFGRKCFSQSDEDGITLEILRRLDALERGVFAEFGVGDGTENNTLVLAALGWKGFWVGGERLKFEVAKKSPARFSYQRAWITLDNITDLAQTGLREIGEKALDVISLDLDGNDFYFAEKMLEKQLRPKLFIVEYNGKFPPPVCFEIAYDPNHMWNGDDYFGASLSSFARLFTRFSYRLVCCNSHTGANAFFVDASYSYLFADVPQELSDIYVEPRYHPYNKFGHGVGIRTVERIINGA